MKIEIKGGEEIQKQEIKTTGDEIMSGDVEERVMEDENFKRAEEEQGKNIIIFLRLLSR